MRERGAFLIGLNALLIGLTGCPGPHPQDCGYAGSQSAPITGVLVSFTDPGGQIGPIADGGPVYVSSAPQGGNTGFIVYAGAYLTNLNPCSVTLAAQLLSPDGGTVLTNRDTRQSYLSVPMGDLFGVNGFDFTSTMPNVPVCDMAGQTFLGPAILQVSITDVNGKHAVLEQPVTGACLNPHDSFCASQCGPR
jgi:hypothetical protein